MLKSLMDAKKISATTNFFDLGVKSMTLVQFQEKIKRDLQIELPRVKFFDASTIRKVSELITAEGDQFRVADDYAGKVKVGKLDVDHNPKSAMQFGVRSIPTILLIKNGEVVDSVVGAVPKQNLVNMIEKHLTPAN